MLKPGGKIWIDWPFLAPLHGYPSHFFNVSREGLTSIFEDLGFSIDSIETGDHQGPDFTISWIMSLFLQALPADARAQVESMTVRELMSIAPRTSLWAELMSKLDDKAGATIGCGNNIVATKHL